MRFPRMTTRRWMVVVAIAGAIGGAWGARERRRAHLESIAYSHLAQIQHLAIGRNPPWPYGILSPLPEDHQARLDFWHLKLSYKYHQASRRFWPWAPLEPDPPAPK